MGIETERVDYNSIALQGFETTVEALFGRTHFLAVACHKGERRAPTAARLLVAARYPVANTSVVPSLCYADFLGCHFTVRDDGLMVLGKTDVAFRYLLLFCDGSREEELGVRKVKELLAVEARGVLLKCAVADVRDQESLLGIA